MKINKKNPDHIAALAISAMNSCLAVVARPFLRIKRPPSKIIVFYGHTLNGNLKAFYDFLLKQEGFEPYFLVLDKHYYARLKASTERPDTILNALSTKDMVTVARADAVITSHGLHLFFIIRALSNIKFIDVWHGVSYKGFGYNEFDHLRSHDEIWVSSEEMKDLYVERYGFSASKVKVTGYARTDKLINGSLNKEDIIDKYSIPQAKKYVLVAPTWQQDVRGRSVLPFDMKPTEFFSELDTIAKKYDAHIIFRTHLNSAEDMDVSHLSNTSFMPYSKYEVVEDFLFIADVLATDWSSIAIDYLPLQRPAIFLDVPAPFKHGFNLGPKHRYGDVVSDFAELKNILENDLAHPEVFQKKHHADMIVTTKSAYGDTLDGKSTERYFQNLKRLLKA